MAHARTPVGVADVNDLSHEPEKKRLRTAFLADQRSDAVAALGPAQELALLKKLLNKQELANQRSQTLMAEVQGKLKASETANNRIRMELKQAQDQLALAKRQHSSEIERGAQRESGLWNDLVEVRSQATTAANKVSGYRKFFAAVLLSIPICLWVVASYVQTPAAQGNERPSVIPGVVNTVKLTSSGAVANAPPDLASASDRLEKALSEYSQKPEDVLRLVHRENAARGISVCAFEWRNGEGSLVFRNEPGPQIATSISECAEAVDKAGK